MWLCTAYKDKIPLCPMSWYLILLVDLQGYNQQQLEECLEEYAALNVWQVNPTSKDVHFTDTD